MNHPIREILRSERKPSLQFGDDEVLKYEDIETPKPKAGHIRWGQVKGLPTRCGDNSLQAHAESRKPNEEIGK